MAKKDSVINFSDSEKELEEKSEGKESKEKSQKKFSEFVVAKNGRRVIISAAFRKKLDRIKARKKA